MKKVAVVILNWNGKKLMEQYLPSVVKYSNSEWSQVIVADNNSEDDSVPFLESNYPQIKVLKLDRNYGFAEGYNRAIKQLNHPFVVLLNSDVEVTPNWLEPMLDLIESNSQIAAIQPKIKAVKQKDHFEYAGASGGFIDYLGYPFCRGRILDQIESDKGQYDNTMEIFWASGAALFIKREMYNSLGGLDGDFFAHMEEIDLCWRLKNRGFKIMCQPQSTVYHYGGGTLPNNSSRKLFLNFRNNLLMMYKNLPQKSLYTTMFLRMLLDGVAAIKFLSGGELSNFGAVFKAHISFYKMLGSYREKRNILVKSTSKDRHNEIYPKSIIRSFFIKKQKHFSDLDF